MHKVGSVRSLRGSDFVVVEDREIDDPPIMPPSCCDELEDEILVNEETDIEYLSDGFFFEWYIFNAKTLNTGSS